MASTATSTNLQCANCERVQETEAQPLQRCARCKTTLYCSKECQASAWPNHKKKCSRPPRPSSVVLLSLEKEDWFDDMYKQLLEVLRSKVEVREILTSEDALDFFSKADHSVPVLITDSSLPHADFASLCEKAVEFVQAGGVMIIGFLLSTFAKYDDIAAMFKQFGLP